MIWTSLSIPNRGKILQYCKQETHSHTYPLNPQLVKHQRKQERTPETEAAREMASLGLGLWLGFRARCVHWSTTFSISVDLRVPAPWLSGLSPASALGGWHCLGPVAGLCWLTGSDTWQCKSMCWPQKLMRLHCYKERPVPSGAEREDWLREIWMSL